MRSNYSFLVLTSTLLWIGMAAFSFTFGQATTTSPYSSYGLGDREGVDHGVFGGLGSTNITYFDSTVLNYFNPASYSFLGKGQPLFTTGVSSRMSTYSEGDAKNFNKYVVINHFAMGFSFAKHFGFTFGLKPFTRKGYNFTTKELLVTDSVQHSYLGSGSTNEVFLGFSSNIVKWKEHQLTIGANTGYVFGTVQDERRSNFTSSTAGGVSQYSTKMKAFHYELGLSYQLKISEKHAFGLTAIVEPAQKLVANQQYDLFYSTYVNNPLYYQKLDSTGSQNGNISLAPSSTIGLSYALTYKDANGKGRIRNSQLSFHLSFNKTDWSLYRTVFAGVEGNPSYSNTTKLTVGVQYIPETGFFGQASKSNFADRFRFRAGAYQYTLPVLFDGFSVVDKGATLGLGMPIGNQKSLSSINLSFSMGNRSSEAIGSLNEKYYGIQATVVFAPAAFERWFVRRKFD